MNVFQWTRYIACAGISLLCAITNDGLLLGQEATDPNKRLLVMERAIRDGDVAVVRKLVADGVDVNARIGSTSLLLIAAGGREPAILKLLLDAGAKLGGLEIVQASSRGAIEQVKLLLAAGADPNGGVVSAATSAQVEVLKLLLDSGPDLNREKNGILALHGVSKAGTSTEQLERQCETIQTLIKAGVDPNARNSRGDTPLHNAVTSEIAVIKVLVDCGARQDLLNQQGFTPARWAILNGRQKNYDWLIAANGGIEPLPFRDPATPLAGKSHDELCRMLIAPNQEVQYAAQRELVSRGKVVMPTVLKRIKNGASPETYYGLFVAMGPAADSALVILEPMLRDKSQVETAISVMECIKPGCVLLRPLEQRKRIAALLYELIRESGEAEIAGPTIQTLWSLRDAAAPYFLRLLRSDNADLRRLAAKMLRLPTFVNNDVNQELLRLARNEKDRSVQKRAITALANVRSDETVPTLLSFIKEPPKFAENDIRRRMEYDEIADSAALSLGAIGPEAIDEVVSLLTPMDGPSRRYAMMVLRRSGPRGIPRIAALLTHEDDAIGGPAALVLTDMKKEGVATLIAAISSENDRESERAVNALAWKPTRNAEVELLKLMASEGRPERLRINAARSALKANPNIRDAKEVLSTIPIAIRALEKGSFREQGHAAETLGMIGPAARDALPQLRQRLILPDKTVDRGNLVVDYVSMAARDAIKKFQEER